jgi:hypothetical protein
MKTKHIILLCCIIGLLVARTVRGQTVTLEDFKLVGNLANPARATFTFTANARVKDKHGGLLDLLSGPVALTGLGPHAKWRLRDSENHYLLTFDRRGVFPIAITFNAAVHQQDDWNSVNFQIASGTLQPVVLQGLAADTRFIFPNAARPERSGTNFLSYLPVDGAVNFSWKQAPPEAEGKLFYAAEMEAQISISPGLMSQAALLNGKVMQGEMSHLSLLLHGPGEVTRVQGDQVLAWTVEAVNNSADRRLVVQFNQPQKDQFALQVQLQSPLDAFPQTADALQIKPEGATRFAGYYRIVNDGAVRLEVVQSGGLSQLSPEQFPESDATRALFREAGSQRFVFRFSSADFALRIQAEQILPEVSVSQVLAYNYGENELAIDDDLELDIREAPLRELLLSVPKGYAVARLVAAGMSDYFLSEPPGQDSAELRLVYGQPSLGRQVVQLRLERNQAPGETNWNLPRIAVEQAKSVRGFVGVSADAGFRLNTDRSQALTEIATAFFPETVAGLQAAFRLSDPAWSATVRVERLPQTVQADVLHLFSIGEGIAYGSSVINYIVSGAPVSALRVDLSDEYYNVEFTGRDIRGWEKTTHGWLVQLNSPMAGSYTLLATFERPFKPQGETLSFTGARPLDAQSEQGHTIIISAYQFQVKPVSVSPGLLSLEPGEVPPEYRLFFDAPVLAAYQYSTRPFDLKIALSPLAQGDSLNQVVDRASLTTHISKQGQVVTDIHYYLKNRGNPNLRVTLAPGTQLWSVSVNNTAVVPVMDDAASLIPLPPQPAPDGVLTVDLKVAATNTPAAGLVQVAAPVLSAPVLLAGWSLEPDEGRRLQYIQGSLRPVGGVPDISGFVGLVHLFTGGDDFTALTELLTGLGFIFLTLVVWIWTARAARHQFSGRHVAGTLLGLLALVIAAIQFLHLGALAAAQAEVVPPDLTFLAPVQPADSALNIEVANLPATTSHFDLITRSWPVLVTVAIWLWGWSRTSSFGRTGCSLLGWLVLAWTALRWPNGAPALFIVLTVFLLWKVVFPSWRPLWRLPAKSQAAGPDAESGTVSAAVSLLIMVLGLGWATTAHGEPMSGVLPTDAVIAESVTQQIEIDDQYAVATARIHWQAERGELLPLLQEPAVLTHITLPGKSVILVPLAAGSQVQQLLAQSSGTFDIEVQYQMPVTKRDTDSGLVLPVPGGLINEVTVTLTNQNVDVVSPAAVSVQRHTDGSNTVATLVLTPGTGAWLGWTPRSRDVKDEKPVFYAEFTQLYVPSPGVIEGAHRVSIRPAQGELGELIFNVPLGATITDVIDPDAGTDTSRVSLWRFDPDTRKLRVNLNPAQSRPFALLIRSQVATGTLPFEQAVGLMSVEGAAGQIGLVGIGTGNEVQLDNVSGAGFSAINLEDFPVDMTATLAAQFSDLTVRRAYRYADNQATALLKASAVEPDVRVQTQDTLSLGEDRTVLASTLDVAITRAGIFHLSFPLPEGYEVESISGGALSHWTELKTDAGRLITLNLTGKTVGEQPFSITLSGPGIKPTAAWPVPQLVLREANKQAGTLLIVPEQGLRLQAATRDGVTQLDPQQSGIRQKGVLAFQVLQTPWRLALDVERVDPWIQVTSLQQATVVEGQIKVAANLQYEIENTGLKTLAVYLPTNVEAVTFKGDQVADFLAVPGAVTNALQEWEIRLHRRVIGEYRLQISYATLMPDQTPETVLRGVRAAQVNLQRGFVTVQAAGRLQVRVDATPETLQPTEWQGIPQALQQDLPAMSANYSYRLVDPNFELSLKIERHEAAKVLPARVNNLTLTSVISDTGMMLTQVRLEMQPGDKRLLHLTLPKGARFWFAFVNQNGVWPWLQQDEILLPLEQPSQGGAAVPVEFFFSSDAGQVNPHALNLDLLAPKFDLPLEDVTWNVYVNNQWQIKHPTGTLELQDETAAAGPAAMDLDSYLQNETSRHGEKTKAAEQMLALGNSALENGDPQQARRAFQSAFGLSRDDSAFNEDARVQLNNIKLQQALVGLNVRQSELAGDNDVVSTRLRELRNRPDANYTQDDAKEIIDRNDADENAALMRLAGRLIQQQDAAVGSPAMIHASLPEQGQLLTFKRSVVVDPWADLNIGLQGTAAATVSTSLRLVVLSATVLILLVFGGLTRRLTKPRAI